MINFSLTKHQFHVICDILYKQIDQRKVWMNIKNVGISHEIYHKEVIELYESILSQLEKGSYEDYKEKSNV